VKYCRTSPVFREKCAQINTALASRYSGHPALLLWHLSNEYESTPCYCSTCLDGFRTWLQARYGGLEHLNHAWWTTFWSHRFTDWEEIVPVDPSNHGMMLDWQRYNSDQVMDFFLAETEPCAAFLIFPSPRTLCGRTSGSTIEAKLVDIACWTVTPNGMSMTTSRPPF
jgi:beta-galactosidase